jgi:hypothetical protein
MPAVGCLESFAWLSDGGILCLRRDHGLLAARINLKHGWPTGHCRRYLLWSGGVDYGEAALLLLPISPLMQTRPCHLHSAHTFAGWQINSVRIFPAVFAPWNTVPNPVQWGRTHYSQTVEVPAVFTYSTTIHVLHGQSL